MNVLLPIKSFTYRLSSNKAPWFDGECVTPKLTLRSYRSSPSSSFHVLWLSRLSTNRFLLHSIHSNFLISSINSVFSSPSRWQKLNRIHSKQSPLPSFDFPSAFDTVDHSLLLQHLDFFFGISGCSFSWLNSYLSNLPPLFLLTTLLLSLYFWCTSEICSWTSSLYSLYLSSPLSHQIFFFSKSAFCRRHLHLLFFSSFIPFFYSWYA